MVYINKEPTMSGSYLVDDDKTQLIVSRSLSRASSDIQKLITSIENSAPQRTGEVK